MTNYIFLRLALINSPKKFIPIRLGLEKTLAIYLIKVAHYVTTILSRCIEYKILGPSSYQLMAGHWYIELKIPLNVY